VGGQVLRVAWYRFPAIFGRRRNGYLAIVLLIGLTGGVAMGSFAAARRTQASFAAFLASTNPSDLSLTVFGPNLAKALNRLPGVERVGTASESVNAFPLGRTGAPIFPPAYLSGEVQGVGSVDGEYFGQDRVTVTAGRMADPDRAGEFVATAQAERLLGWHVGEVIPMGFYTDAQTGQPTFGTTKVKPHRRLNMRLAGTVVFNNEVVVDEIDRFPAFLLFTPALTRLVSMGTGYRLYGLRLSDGARGVPAVEREIVGALPPGTTYTFHVTSVVEGQVDRAVKPEAIALAVFGIIAMAAALLIAVQVIARQTLHTSMGTGAIIPIGIEPPAFQRFLHSPYPALNGPQMVFVRLRPGVTPAEGLASLQRIADAGNRAFAAVPNGAAAGASVKVVRVQYPAEIENYRSMGATPVLLAAGLAIGAVAALGLTLAAAVRRRRRDLALLKALGFTRRQLAACVAWQPTIAATIGVIAGIPLGIALGRWLWILFAHQIYAVPRPTVPALPLACIGLGALVLANVAAALPGRYAARTPTALVLRTE